MAVGVSPLPSSLLGNDESSPSQASPSSAQPLLNDGVASLSGYGVPSTFIGAFKINLQPKVASLPTKATYTSILKPKRPSLVLPRSLGDPQTLAAHSLKPITSYEGKPAIAFSVSEKLTLIDKLKYVLIAKSTHGRPPLAIIKKFFLNMMLKGELNLSVFDSKHLYVECTYFEDYVKIWSKGVWLINGFPLRMFKWDEDFEPSRESAIVPVWIHMPRLPLFLFEEKALLSIANVIGRPLKFDINNLNRSKLGCASFCVEVDVSKVLVDTIWITVIDDISGQVCTGFSQKVLYGSFPRFCTGCAHLGHSESSCLRRIEEKGKQAVSRKDSQAELGLHGSAIPVPTAFNRLHQSLENFGLNAKFQSGQQMGQQSDAVNCKKNETVTVEKGRKQYEGMLAFKNSSDSLLFEDVICAEMVAAARYRVEDLCSSDSPASSINSAGGYATSNGAGPGSARLSAEGLEFKGLLTSKENAGHHELAARVTASAPLYNDGGFATEKKTAPGADSAGTGDAKGLNLQQQKPEAGICNNAKQGCMLAKQCSSVRTEQNHILAGNLQTNDYGKGIKHYMFQAACSGISAFVEVETADDSKLDSSGKFTADHGDSEIAAEPVAASGVEPVVEAAEEPVAGAAARFAGAAAENGREHAALDVKQTAGAVKLNGNEEETVIKHQNDAAEVKASITPRNLSGAAAEFTPKWAVLVEELVEGKKQSENEQGEESLQHVYDRIKKMNRGKKGSKKGNLIRPTIPHRAKDETDSQNMENTFVAKVNTSKGSKSNGFIDYEKMMSILRRPSRRDRDDPSLKRTTTCDTNDLGDFILPLEVDSEPSSPASRNSHFMDE